MNIPFIIICVLIGIEALGTTYIAATKKEPGQVLIVLIKSTLTIALIVWAMNWK